MYQFTIGFHPLPNRHSPAILHGNQLKHTRLI